MSEDKQFDKKGELKRRVGDVLRAALRGDLEYKTSDGFTRWGRVQQDIDQLIDLLAPPSAEQEWQEGEAPKDGRAYEMRRRVDGVAGPESDFTAWQWNGWWDGKQYVRRNQMHGGTEPLLFPTHWRQLAPSSEGAQINAAPQAVDVEQKGTSVNLPELSGHLDSSGEACKERLTANRADVSRPAGAAPSSIPATIPSEQTDDVSVVAHELCDMIFANGGSVNLGNSEFHKFCMRLLAYKFQSSNAPSSPIAASTGETPRTDAIKAELQRKYPDPLPDGERKLRYYMEAAECFGQECAHLERDLAEVETTLQDYRKRWLEAVKAGTLDHNDAVSATGGTDG